MSKVWKEGVDYIKLGQPVMRGTRKIYSARCLHCNAEFTNHRSIQNHKDVCLGHPQDSNQLNLDPFISKKQNEDVDISEIMKLFIEAFVSLDLPLSAVENDHLKRFLNALSPEFIIPSKKEFRKMLISFSENEKKTNIYSIKGENVSLIIDGTTTWGEKLYEVVVFHPTKMFHYGLVELPVATAERVSTKLTQIINKLLDETITVSAVTTDNGPNLVAAFRETNEYAVSKGITLPCIRFACMAHTAQLLLDDLRRSSHEFETVEDDVSHLIQWSRKSANKNKMRSAGFAYKLPSISETRWNSLVEALLFFNNHRDFFEHFLEESDDIEKPSIEFESWPSALEAISPIMVFTNKVQGNTITIAQAFCFLLELEADLRELTGNPFVPILQEKVRTRFSTTCDSDLCELAYLLTHKGHSWWEDRRKSLPDSSKRTLTTDESNALIAYYAELNGLKNVLASQATKYGVDATKCCDAFIIYLTHGIDNYKDDLAFWYDSRGRVDNGTCFFDLAVVASSLLVIPATEAVAERVFSHLKRIHTSSRASSKPDILDALINIRTSLIWSQI